MKNKFISLLLLSALLSSCFKEDERVTPHIPGEILTATIPMTMYYSNQVYFNLQKQDIISINNRSIFDLNFSCGDSSTIIRLNTANFATAAITPFTNITDVTDTTGLNWKFDTSDGNIDSLAINNWITIFDNDTLYSNKVWVINRGLNSVGEPLGLKKIQFIKFENGSYHFKYSNMDNSSSGSAIVKQDNDFSYIQYSFENETAEQLEPEIYNWDLLFTQYTTMLITSEGEPYPYLLTGVLQNNAVTTIAFDSLMIFSDIKLADTVNFNFSSSLDKIGYNWKKLVGDVNTGNVYYEIKLNYNYIIKGADLYYYKLRFINFYNPENGEKGYPSFEYQKL